MSTPYSPYGIGISVLALPAYLVSKWTGHLPILVSVIAPVLMALCVVLLFRMDVASAGSPPIAFSPPSPLGSCPWPCGTPPSSSASRQ